ncbi:MAG: hypothetical protein JKY25_04660 [Robiginitomaculum sp.]|nr:hypothetical protein [Robiginitomaculum sp.]
METIATTIRMSLTLAVFVGLSSCGPKEKPPEVKLTEQQEIAFKKAYSVLPGVFLPQEAKLEMVKLLDALAEHDIEYIVNNGSNELLAVENIRPDLEKLMTKYVVTGAPEETILLDASISKAWSSKTGSTTTYYAEYERVFETYINIFKITLIRNKKTPCCKVQGININLKERSVIKEE